MKFSVQLEQYRELQMDTLREITYRLKVRGALETAEVRELQLLNCMMCFILTCVTGDMTGLMRLTFLMRTLPLMSYPVNMLRGKHGAAIGLCKCAVRCLMRCFIPCGITTMSLYMVRSAPSQTHIRLSMNSYVYFILTFYLIATAIDYSLSLPHVFEYTSYRDGGRRGRHCCSIAAA